MKSVTNRALWAKKLYNQPSVELAEVQATSLMQAASPSGLPTGDPVPNEGGD